MSKNRVFVTGSTGCIGSHAVRVLLNEGFIVYCTVPSTRNSIQILTASSAMVKTMTPEVIPGAFYFPEAKPRESRTLRGSPRES